MRVTPDLVSVWYLRPFDSNSMTWGRAGAAHSKTTRPQAPASRCMTPYYDSAGIRCAWRASWGGPFGPRCRLLAASAGRQPGLASRLAPRSRGLIPCRVKLLFIRLRQSDALADFPARTLRRLDDGHGAMVLLHDHLGALLDLCQHGVEYGGRFGFRNASPQQNLWVDSGSGSRPK